MQTIAAIIFGLLVLWCGCYFVAAMGNHGKYRQRHENDFGCAIILFILALLGLGWSVIKLNGYELHAIIIFVGLILAGVIWFNSKKPGS